MYLFFIWVTIYKQTLCIKSVCFCMYLLFLRHIIVVFFIFVLIKHLIKIKYNKILSILQYFITNIYLFLMVFLYKIKFIFYINQRYNIVLFFL